MLNHQLYVTCLNAAFVFWNAARIFTYLPTIAILLRRDANVRSYSLITWGTWALSNATFALMLLEVDGAPGRLFWMHCGNTAMCIVVFAIVAAKRRSAGNGQSVMRRGNIGKRVVMCAAERPIAAVHRTVR